MKSVLSIYRLFFALFIAFLIGLLFIRINGYAETQSNENQKITVQTSTNEFEEEITNIIFLNEGTIINFQESAILLKTNQIINFEEQAKEIYFDTVTDFKITNGTGFFLIGNLIYQADLTTEELNLTEISDLNNYNLNARGIIIYNETIYAYGEIENDAAVIALTLEDDELNRIILGGTASELFIDAFVLNQKLFLIGEKDSISHESPLQNVGLPNTKKIFILSYDLNLDEQLDQIYFNQIETSEEYLNYLIKDDYFYIKLNSSILKIDENLNLLIQDQTVNCDLDKNYFLFETKNKIKTIIENNKKITLDNIKLTNIEGNIFLTKVYNGNLIIYTINQNKINTYKISEYHIEKNDIVTTNRLYPEINFQNKLIINSYFENLKIEINNLNPTLLKNIDGVYDITYKITKEDGTFFLIDGKYELKPFINIVEGGIYQIDKELLFYGNAKLNGQIIYNGYKVKEEGNYELKITNANNKETTYHFKIIENYYKDDECITIKPDIVINKNKNFKININFKKDKNTTIRELWINSSKYENFTVQDQQITINLTSDTKYSVKNYHIDKIVYEEDQLYEYPINENYVVMTLKDNPEIYMEKEINNQKITLNYEFNDQDKSFNYLKTELYNGNDLVGVNYNYFNSKIKIMNLDLKQITCKHYLVSFDGYNTSTTEIMEYEIKNYNYNKFLNSIFTVEQHLNNLKIEMDPVEADLISLSAADNNLIKDLKITDNNLNPKTIIIISSIIIGLGIITLFLFKTKILPFKKEKTTIKSK